MAKKCLGLLIAACMLAGCGGYTRLVKSKDHEKMYQAALDYYHQGKFTKTLQLLQDVAPVYTGTLRADTIQFYAAAATHRMGDYATSGQLLEDFRRTYGANSPFVEEAEYMYAMGFFFASPSPERDQTNTHRALAAIAEYLDRYPAADSARIAAMNNCIVELRNKLWDKEFINANSYYRTQKYKSAVIALRGVLDTSPENPHREEMMYLTARSGYLLARNSIETLQRDRYLSMMDYCLNLTTEFPQSRYVKEAEKMMDEARAYLAATDPQTTKTDDNENQPQ